MWDQPAEAARFPPEGKVLQRPSKPPAHFTGTTTEDWPRVRAQTLHQTGWSLTLMSANFLTGKSWTSSHPQTPFFTCAMEVVTGPVS
jgi:hypothetical protein